MDPLRITHVIEMVDPEHREVRNWLERYERLMSEAAASEHFCVDAHMRRQRRVVTATEVYESLQGLKVKPADLSRQTARMFSYLWVDVPRIRFYCAGHGHVRGECECRGVTAAQSKTLMNSPRYRSLQDGQTYRQWMIDYEDLLGLTFEELDGFPRQIAYWWGEVIRLLVEPGDAASPD